MESPILFYDGDCGFCLRSVQFVLDHERERNLLFCSLQSEKAKEILGDRIHSIPEGTQTMLFLKGKQLYQKSEAALQVCRYLNKPWNALRFLSIVPVKIRDGVYDLIARNRKRWRKGYTCRVPDPWNGRRFLS